MESLGPPWICGRAATKKNELFLPGGDQKSCCPSPFFGVFSHSSAAPHPFHVTHTPMRTHAHVARRAHPRPDCAPTPPRPRPRPHITHAHTLAQACTCTRIARHTHMHTHRAHTHHRRPHASPTCTHHTHTYASLTPTSRPHHTCSHVPSFFSYAKPLLKTFQKSPIFKHFQKFTKIVEISFSP